MPSTKYNTKTKSKKTPVKSREAKEAILIINALNEV